MYIYIYIPTVTNLYFHIARCEKAPTNRVHFIHTYSQTKTHILTYSHMQAYTPFHLHMHSRRTLDTIIMQISCIQVFRYRRTYLHTDTYTHALSFIFQMRECTYNRADFQVPMSWIEFVPREVCVCMHACLCVCTCMRVCTCMYLCMHVCM